MIKSLISPKLIAAYKSANYTIICDQPVVLNIGQPSRQLLKLHNQFRCTCSAFITAWNPYSKAVSEDENVAAQARLEAYLAERSFSFVTGKGEDSTGNWPGEPSVLVFGTSQDEAESIGIQFLQNAIVWNHDDAIPQLNLLR
jgi:hypothetical protein